MYLVLGYPILRSAVNHKTGLGGGDSDECRELNLEGNRRNTGSRSQERGVGSLSETGTQKQLSTCIYSVY